jgi:hypothetical protein
LLSETYRIALSASTIGDVPTARKPTAVLDALAVIAEKGDAVESLARDAYEISFSSRRVGAETPFQLRLRHDFVEEVVPRLTFGAIDHE